MSDNNNNHTLLDLYKLVQQLVDRVNKCLTIVEDVISDEDVLTDEEDSEDELISVATSKRARDSRAKGWD